MKLAVTGHTRGIGKAIYDLYPYSVGFSRSNGYDIGFTDIIDKISTESRECDVFVNNAYHKEGQQYMFVKMFNAWKNDSSKTIINIISIAKYGLGYTEEEKEYSRIKTNLYNCAKEKMFGEKKCRVININPGYVRTDMVSYIPESVKMLSTDQIAKTVKWTLDQPQEIEIGELSIWINS